MSKFFINRPIVARGAAYADFDHDGDLDVLISTNNGPAYLYRNDGGNRNHWLSVRLVGSKSNRDGLGAVVRVQSALGKQWNMVRSGSSYCSQSDLALVFGLGGDTSASEAEPALFAASDVHYQVLCRRHYRAGDLGPGGAGE